MLLCVVMVLGALSFSACGAPLPSPPASVGDDYPDGGIPVSVTWPSDWYDAAQRSGEIHPSPRLVELELQMVGGEPTWRITPYDTETLVSSEISFSAA